MTPLPAPNDSGLRDCNVPLAQLRAKCADGYSCVHYSVSQFPETVHVKNEDPKRAADCSGVVIGPNWILTDAHCITEEQTSKLTGVKGSDYVDPHPGLIAITAANAFSLPPDQRGRVADKVIVYSKYSGEDTGVDDLALVHINAPFPADNVPPARLIVPDKQSFSKAATSAGYGVTDSKTTPNGFAIAWLPPLTNDSGFLTFAPSNGITPGDVGAFCQGDSGGAVFIGYDRGCTPADVDGEKRPRLLEGVNGRYILGQYPPGTPSKDRDALQCESSQSMSITSLLIKDRHTWICKITGNSAGNCP